MISRELLESVPNSRSNCAALTPGASRSTDVGGSNGTDSGSTFSIHGGRGADTRRLIDGMRWNSMEAANAGTGFYYDPTAAAEIAIQLGGNSAEYELGGVQVNLVPKSGGNRFNGYLYAGYTNNHLNSTGIPTALQDRGLPTIGAVDYIYDYSGSLGGPIRQDKLWFFSAQRWWGNSTFVPGDYCHGALTGAAAPEGTYRWNFGRAGGRHRVSLAPGQRLRLLDQPDVERQYISGWRPAAAELRAGLRSHQPAPQR